MSSSAPYAPESQPEPRTLIDALLDEQSDLTPVERFARWHDAERSAAGLSRSSLERSEVARVTGDRPTPELAATEPAALRRDYVRSLIPLTAPKPGEQYAFEVDLDRCSGCKSCVTACHALNGLDDHETWRSVGLLHGPRRSSFQQTITTACHHCVDPACMHGCPVLAYDKDPLTGIVRHLDDQCIGCQYCIFMCPYEVPQYSKQRGIVRKCDMCHQRLAHNEAPACVQACPSEAIRITVVKQESVRQTYAASNSSFVIRHSPSTNPFLPCSPDPSITLPTTRYVSAKPLPPDVTSGNSAEATLQPSHLPLVWMLLLTQLGAGCFFAAPFVPRTAQTLLTALGLAGIVFGLGISILHLGCPQKAWRAFLGLRHSWLSREIVSFGCFLLLSTTSVAALSFHADALAAPVVAAAGAFGALGVFCSAMTYHVTRRECWRGELSIGRFFGTMFILGSAAASCASAFSGANHKFFAVNIILGSGLKLWRELAFIRLCPDDADLNDEIPADLRARGAFLMRFRAGLLLRLRLAVGWLGGVALPLISAFVLSNPRAATLISLLLCLAGELAERVLFFRAAAVSKMPGNA